MVRMREKVLVRLAGKKEQQQCLFKSWGREGGVWESYIIGPCGLLRNNTEDGCCNTGDLLGFIGEGNSIFYEDYEWYNTIEDSELKDEALINKGLLEESMNVERESSDDACETKAKQGCFDKHNLMEDDDDDIGDLEVYLIRKDPPYYVNKDDERSKERRCKLLEIPYVKPPTCKSEKFKVVKYSFGPVEEYLAIKEFKYHIWVRTEENVSQFYQDIFRKKDEGWSVTRTK
nr:hypothetical protein [Tanacetum cinerariifolium]